MMFKLGDQVKEKIYGRIGTIIKLSSTRVSVKLEHSTLHCSIDDIEKIE